MLRFVAGVLGSKCEDVRFVAGVFGSKWGQSAKMFDLWFEWSLAGQGSPFDGVVHTLSIYHWLEGLGFRISGLRCL